MFVNLAALYNFVQTSDSSDICGVFKFVANFSV